MALPGVDSFGQGITSVILGLVIIGVALHFAATRKVHPDEPTVLVPWIPFVGHLVGMAVYGGRYIKKLGYMHLLLLTLLHCEDANAAQSVAPQ
jgi:hypothetical protein